MLLAGSATNYIQAFFLDTLFLLPSKINVIGGVDKPRPPFKLPIPLEGISL